MTTVTTWQPDGGRLPHTGRPRIGMCAHTGPMKLSVYDMPATFVPQVFVTLLVEAGCLPVLLPPLPECVDAVGAVDGLLLLPGPDVDPALYRAVPDPRTRYDSDRDAVELGMLDAAVTAGLPILGICRGLQLLNVRAGGTLHQHLPEVVRHQGHDPGEVDFGDQRVRLRPDSGVAAALGVDTAVVPCHHHQAVDRLGDGLIATAWADDGVVEALELPDHPFAVSVQWHAERSADTRLFDALAAAARRHRATTP